MVKQRLYDKSTTSFNGHSRVYDSVFNGSQSLANPTERLKE